MILINIMKFKLLINYLLHLRKYELFIIFKKSKVKVHFFHYSKIIKLKSRTKNLIILFSLPNNLLRFEL